MFPGLSENVSANLSSKVSKLEDRNLRTPAAQVSCRCSKRQSVIGRSGRKSGTIGIVRRKFAISAKGKSIAHRYAQAYMYMYLWQCRKSLKVFI